MNVFSNANVHSVINFAIFYDNYMYLGSVSFEPDFMLDSLPAHITMLTLLPLLRLDWWNQTEPIAKLSTTTTTKTKQQLAEWHR